jgi:hypothetical protein
MKEKLEYSQITAVAFLRDQPALKEMLRGAEQ